MLIRNAEPKDSNSLTEIAIAAKRVWGYSEATMKLWEAELTITSDAIRKNPTFVAEENGAPIGFCMLDRERDRFSLEHFWIAPTSMRQGVGRKLLARAIEAVRERHGDALHIDADPNAAVFYQACGAVACGTVAAPIAEDPNRVRPQFVLKFVVPAITYHRKDI